MKIRDYIHTQVFARRLSNERPTLVIYDPARRYRSIALGLANANTRVLDAGLSVIEQREAAMSGLRELAAGKLQHLVIWTPADVPTTPELLQTDPFGAVAVLGDTFPRRNGQDGDDYKALCRLAKPDHVAEIEKLFAEGEPSFETLDALDEGGTWPILKSLLGAASAKEILLCLLVPKAENEAAFKTNAAWVDEMREFLARTLGHKLRTKGQTRASIADEVWRLVLFSEFVFDSQGTLPDTLSTVPIGNPEAKGLIYDLCDDLRKHQDFRADYIKNAEAIETALALPQRAIALTNLGERDTFAFEERFFLLKCAASIVAGALIPARKILGARAHSIWLSHESRLVEWTIIERALDLIEAVEQAEAPRYLTLEALVRAYAANWRDLDRRHRELEQAITDWHDEHEGLDSLVTAARKSYLKVAGLLQAEFLKHVTNEGWPAHGNGLLRNAEVFDREVGPVLEARQKVAYFLVDSLRYELAAELEKQLSAKHKVRLITVCAQLPTYTEVGMASLMPEAVTALHLANRDGKLVTTLGGAVATAPATRFAYLESKKGDLCHDIELDALINQKKFKLAERVRLLVVRTREIDSVAHESPRSVLQLIPDLMRQILRGIAKVEAAGFQKIVIATDHGFILLHEQAAGNVTAYPPGEWLVKKSRCVLGSGSGDGGSILFPKEQVGIPGDFTHYAAPKGLVPYVRDHLYYHEGLSLQECVLPCLSIDLVPQTPKKSSLLLQLSYKQGRTDKITSRRPVIDLIWPQSELALDDGEAEIAIEALDAKGAVVGWIASGPTVNLATQGVRIRSGQAVSISLRMDDDFSGNLTVRAYDPTTQAQLADLKLKTDYYDA
jgi:hypothetical protein